MEQLENKSPALPQKTKQDLRLPLEEVAALFRKACAKCDIATVCGIKKDVMSEGNLEQSLRERRRSTCAVLNQIVGDQIEFISLESH